MTENERVKAFQAAVQAASNEFKVGIGGCGCCGSPYIVVYDEDGCCGSPHIVVYDEDGDCVSEGAFDGTFYPQADVHTPATPEA